MDWNGEFSRRRNNNDKEISQKLFKILSNQGNANSIFFFFLGFILPQSEGPRPTKQPTNAGGEGFGEKGDFIH